MAGVQHIDLVVSSIERSLPFYRELLAPLGYHRISEVEGERGETIWYLSGPGVAIGLREAQSGRRARPLRGRRPPHRLRGVVARDGRRARRVADRARRRDRERAGGVRLPTGLLRGVLLRPGRDKAGDRPHPRSGSLEERRRPDGRFRPAPRTRVGRPVAPHAAAPPRVRAADDRAHGVRPPPPARPPPGYTIPADELAGRRAADVPGNAEWALWFFVEILFAIIWASSDQVDASDCSCIATAIITFAYLISRGIAKASRVLEQ